MLTEIISKTVADKTVDSILKRIERAVPVPEPATAASTPPCARRSTWGPPAWPRKSRTAPCPTKRIALMGEVARVACRARLVGMECRVVVDEEARACNR